MRNKSGHFNQRRFHLSSFLTRKPRPGKDETDWYLLEADLGPASPKRKSREPGSRRTWLVRILAVACLSVTIPMGARWGHEAIFYKNEGFVLKQLVIRSDGMLSEANLAEIANVSGGMNLMEIDLEKIRTRIEKLAQVKEVEVSREMPDLLNIQVRERVPIAWLSCPPLGIRPGDMERGFLLDDKGVLFRCLDLTEGIQQLPHVETFKMAEPAENTVLSVDGAMSALKLISNSSELDEFENMNIHVVRLRNEWSIQCHYRSGLQVTFARHEIERGVEDLKLILSQAAQLGTPLATVNVAAAENIPVTFAGPLDPVALGNVAKPLVKSELSTPQDSKQKHLQSILKGG